jgi:hypothetical protein
MRYFRLLIFALLLLQTGIASALAGTDFKCMSDCTQNGYLYNYCQSHCSYDDPIPTPAPPIPQPHGTDFKCMTDCSQRGYLYSYCQQTCGY